MSYQGMMDGWHGDEMECRGHCGICNNCEQRLYYFDELEDYENRYDYEENGN